MGHPNSRRRGRALDPGTLSINVAETARTVAKVLDGFAEGLLRGGFESGLGAYRQMAETVVNQRLWAISHGEAAAEEVFERIVVQAGRIGGLLRDYVEVMEKLASLNEARESLAPAAPMAGLPEADRAVVAWLASRGGAASTSQIRAGTSLASAVLTPALARLEASGALRRSSSAGRLTYSLTR